MKSRNLSEPTFWITRTIHLLTLLLGSGVVIKNRRSSLFFILGSKFNFTLPPVIFSPVLLASLVVLILLVLDASAVYAREVPPKPIFKLIQGQGTEVCEAYLERLNTTEYLDNNPVKGRMTEPLLKGFVDLKPMPLTAEEIQHIHYKTISFDHFQDQELIKKFSKKWDENWKHLTGRGLEGIGFPPNTLEAINKFIVSNKKTPFVRYQVQLDLDNDGIVGDVVIKNNCGVYIVDSQLQQIDEARMKRILADQEALDWPTMYQFPSLAFPITVFGYNKKYYFDGFFNNLIFEKGQPVNINHEQAPYLLGVFIHEQQQTRRVCEYEWVNGFYEWIPNNF